MECVRSGGLGRTARNLSLISVPWLPCAPPLTRFPHTVSTGPAPSPVPRFPVWIDPSLLASAFPFLTMSLFSAPYCIGSWFSDFPSFLGKDFWYSNISLLCFSTFYLVSLSYLLFLEISHYSFISPFLSWSMVNVSPHSSPF